LPASRLKTSWVRGIRSNHRERLRHVYWLASGSRNLSTLSSRV